jgi:hypothetical protein
MTEAPSRSRSPPLLRGFGGRDPVRQELGRRARELSGPDRTRTSIVGDLGWDVRVLDGLDHVQAMQATQVVPILRSWLASRVTLCHRRERLRLQRDAIPKVM